MQIPLLTKILKGDPTRRSRLHSGRNQVLPLSELPWAVRSVVYRATRRYPDGPWMTPGSVRHLKRALSRDMSLLELGSGVSTAWYARHAGRVVSLEPERDWAERVARELIRYPNAELREVAIEPELRRIAASGEKFDVVVVDFDERNDFTRPEAVRLARDIATRMIVLDDSDRPAYRVTDKLMSDWRVDRFPGVKSVPLAVWETSVFTRNRTATQ